MKTQKQLPQKHEEKKNPHNTSFPLAGTIILFLVAILYRIYAPIPNFSPVVAIALLAALYIPQRKGVVVLPLLLMFASDLYLGLHSTIPFVYGSLILIALIGFHWQKRIYSSENNISLIEKITSPFGYALFSSFLFFIITNFGVWIMGSLYAYTWEGFVSCFVNALPFYRNAVVGDLVFTGVLYLPMLLFSLRKRQMVHSNR